MKRLIVILIMIVFLWQDAGICAQKGSSSLRPGLVCDSKPGRSHGLEGFRDDGKRYVLSHVRHGYYNIVKLCSVYINLLEENCHDSGFKGLCRGAIAELDDWYEGRKNLDKIHGIDAYIEILSSEDTEKIIGLIGRLINEFEKSSGKVGTAKLKRYVDVIERQMESLKHFTRLLPFLDTQARSKVYIDELMELYFKNLVLEGEKKCLDLELSDTGLITDEIIEYESVIFICVIQDFIENALREDGNRVVIRAGRDDGDKWIKIEISDTGSGIPRQKNGEEFLSRIFEKGITSNKGPGRGGKGLYLTLQYLRSKSGKIQVDTKRGGKPADRLVFIDDSLEEISIAPSDRKETGTTFTIWLPAASGPVERSPEEIVPSIEVVSSV